MLARTHKGPEDAATFPYRVRLDLDLCLEQRLGWLRRHVDADTVPVEFPPMVHTTQPAPFVAAEEHGRAPMRAEGIDQADIALGIPKGDQYLRPGFAPAAVRRPAPEAPPRAPREANSGETSPPSAFPDRPA